MLEMFVAPERRVLLQADDLFSHPPMALRHFEYDDGGLGFSFLVRERRATAEEIPRTRISRRSASRTPAGG